MRSSGSASWRGRFWGSWRRRSGSVPLPFDSDGLLPFTSDGLKGFWFCFLARKVLGLLARSSGSASGQGRFWGSWRGVLVLLPGKEGSRAPGEEFWFCFLVRKVLRLLARSSGSASWRGRFWGSWRGVLVLLPGVEGSGAPGVGVLVLVRLACFKEVNPTQGSECAVLLLA